MDFLGFQHIISSISFFSFLSFLFVGLSFRFGVFVGIFHAAGCPFLCIWSHDYCIAAWRPTTLKIFRVPADFWHRFGLDSFLCIWYLHCCIIIIFIRLPACLFTFCLCWGYLHLSLLKAFILIYQWDAPQQKSPKALSVLCRIRAYALAYHNSLWKPSRYITNCLCTSIEVEISIFYIESIFQFLIRGQVSVVRWSSLQSSDCHNYTWEWTHPNPMVTGLVSLLSSNSLDFQSKTLQDCAFKVLPT